METYYNPVIKVELSYVLFPKSITPGYELKYEVIAAGQMIDMEAYDYQVSLPTWYRDSDGDGFGNASVTKDSCAMPLGYVSDMTDCDDTDANERSGQTWFIDNYSDSYRGSSITQCLRPIKAKTPKRISI